jgi:hypothetical protein
MKHRTRWSRHTTRGALIALQSVLLLTLALGSGARAESDATLVFLEDKLSLSPDEDEKIVGHFTLQNKGPTVSISAFEMLLVDKKGTPVDTPPTLSVTPVEADESAVCRPADPCQVLAYDSAQFRIEVLGVESEKSLTGYLEIDAVETDTGSGVVAEVLPVELKLREESAKLFGFLDTQAVTSGTVVGIGLIAALLTFVVSFVWLLVSYTGKDMSEVVMGDLGIISWDLSKNWLANVTGLSAITLAVVGLTILPETTQFLTKTEKINEFAALHAVFGLGVTVAPLVGAMLTTIFPHTPEADASRVWIYVLAVSIVMWSVTGELLTALIFFDEIRAGGMMDSLAVSLFQIVLAIIWGAAFVYAVKKTVRSALQIIVGQDQENAVKESMNAVGYAIIEGLKTQSPSNAADGLKLGEKKHLESLKGYEKIAKDKEYISVWYVLTQLLKALRACDRNEEGKKKARTMLEATYGGLEGVLTAMRPKDDGTSQPSSALPSAVTKLCQLFEEAAELCGLYTKPTVLPPRSTISSAEVRKLVKEIYDRVSKQLPGDTGPVLLSWRYEPYGLPERVAGFEPTRATYVRPTPKVYLP